MSGRMTKERAAELRAELDAGYSLQPTPEREVFAEMERARDSEERFKKALEWILSERPEYVETLPVFRAFSAFSGMPIAACVEEDGYVR